MNSITACIIRRAVVYAVDPTGETSLVRFASEQVNILLPHKVFSAIEWIVRFPVVYRRENGIRMLAQLTELANLGTEAVIQPRRRQNIQSILLNVLEMIEAVGVGNGQPILRSAHPNPHAFNRMSILIENATTHCTVSCRRSGDWT